MFVRSKLIPPSTLPEKVAHKMFCKINNSPTSPLLRVSRRMLPETPKVSSNNRDLKSDKSCRQRSKFFAELSSRDSLDSGVFSRSTTCDSTGKRDPMTKSQVLNRGSVERVKWVKITKVKYCILLNLFYRYSGAHQYNTLIIKGSVDFV